MTEISLIIPISSKTLSKYSLLNLLNQIIELNEVEIICVLNSVYKKYYDFLENYALKYSFFNLIYINDNSIAKIKNEGIACSKSEYVMFINTEFFYELDYFEKILYYIKNYSFDILHNVNNIYNNENEHLPDIKINDEIRIGSINSVPQIFKNISLYTTIFNSSFLKEEEIYFDESSNYHELLFIFSVYMKASKLGIIDEKLYLSKINNNVVEEDKNYDIYDILDLFSFFKQVLMFTNRNNISKYFIEDFLSEWICNFFNIFLSKPIFSSHLAMICNEGNSLFNELKNSDVSLPISYDYLLDNIINKSYENIYNLINLNKKTDGNVSNSIPQLQDLNVAVIMDPFTYNSFSSECNLIPLTPENWKEEFKYNSIDLFFCESVWAGVDVDNIVDGIALENGNRPWNNKIAVKLKYNTGNEKTIFEILDYCKKQGIPTIFWNKEDPTSFEKFVDVALKFDYIFTTDEDSIFKYQVRGHKNVHNLLFASQIKLFNPIENNTRSNDIIFAGSWYNEFKKRCSVMDDMFGKILQSKYNLKIYDRQSGNLDSSREFPRKYSKFINPAKQFNQMPEVYKESKFALNVNSITNSNTMFSRRIFELMSSNTFVISNFSKGIYDLFGNDVLYLDKEDNLEIDNKFIEKTCEKNLYNILENHTYHQRFKHILDIINLNYIEKNKIVHILYFLSSNSYKDISEDFYSFEYPYKKCIIIYDENSNSEINKEYAEEIMFLRKSECLSFLMKTSDNDYWIIRNINKKIDKTFFNKAFLHYQYIEENIGIMEDSRKYIIDFTREHENILFNNPQKRIILNVLNNLDEFNEIVVYTI